jgi:hypothetical protein
VNFNIKIGAAPGIIGNDILYRDDRIIRFDTRINYNNSLILLSSERIVIPENLTIITRRFNVPALRYNLVINIFKGHDAGTIMMHMDEFESENPDEERDSQNLIRLKMTTAQLMEKIKSYFNKGI